MAVTLGVDHHTIVSTACDCMELTPTSKFVVAECVAIVRKWLAGDANLEDVMEVRERAAAAYCGKVAYCADSCIEPMRAAWVAHAPKVLREKYVKVIRNRIPWETIETAAKKYQDQQPLSSEQLLKLLNDTNGSNFLVHWGCVTTQKQRL